MNSSYLTTYISKIAKNRDAAHTAYFQATRLGTKGVNDTKLAKLMIAAGIGYLAF